MQEQEKKIYSFTGNGSRLQLLKIADKYVIRLNRKKIWQTYNQEVAFRRMQHETNLLLMQKTINFEELEPIQAPERYSQKYIDLYEKEILQNLQNIK